MRRIATVVRITPAGRHRNGIHSEIAGGTEAAPIEKPPIAQAPKKREMTAAIRSATVMLADGVDERIWTTSEKVENSSVIDSIDCSGRQ
jgi:hypothetical protein